MLRWEPRPLSPFSGSAVETDREAGKPLNVHCTDCGLVALGKAERPGTRFASDSVRKLGTEISGFSWVTTRPRR